MTQATELEAALLGDSYFARTAHASSLMRRLADAGPHADTLLQYRDMCFFIIKPDAIRARLTERILNWLHTAGLEVIWSKAIWDSTGKLSEDLYKFNLTLANEQNQFVSWWVNSQVYRSGPMLALLLTQRNSSSGMSTHDRVASTKGYCVPWLAKPGTLRWEFEGCNRVMNLVHASDDPISSIREFLIFSTFDEMRIAASRSQDHVGSALERRRELEVAQILATSSGGTRSFTELACRLKLLLARLLFTTYNDEAVRTEMIALTTLYASWYTETELRGARQFGGYELLFDIGDRERRALEKITPNRKSTSLFDCLHGLADPNQYDETLAQDIVAMLERYGMPLSAWDRLVLVSSMHYGEDVSAYGRSRHRCDLDVAGVEQTA